MDDNEEIYNIESNEDTEEYEAYLRIGAIGNTLYDQRLVLNTVRHISADYNNYSRSHLRRNNSQGIDDDDDDDEELSLYEKESQVGSLLEMSLEPDVCAFLASSGCMQVILEEAVKLESQLLVNTSLKIYINVLKSGNEDRIINMRQFQILVELLFCVSDTTILAKIFTCLNKMCELVLISEENSEDYDEVRRSFREPLLKALHDEHFIYRLSTILNNYSNENLLEAIVSFLSSLVECASEFSEIVISDSQYTSPKFMYCLVHALQESLNFPNLTFNLVEIISILCAQDNLRECSEILCNVLMSYYRIIFQETGEHSLSTLATVTKICSQCWKHSTHKDSLEMIREIFLSAEATLASNSDKNSRTAMKIIQECLQDYDSDNSS